MPALNHEDNNEALQMAADSAIPLTTRVRGCVNTDLEDAPTSPVIEHSEDDDARTNVSRSHSSDDNNDATTATRPLTYKNGVALMIGLQIGSGIFSTPATVITLIPSQPWAVAIWASAGLLVWTGAASFAELGTLCPNNGGILQYLRHCFGSAPGEAGDVAGFLFSWVWIAVVKPCVMSMIAMVFAEYFFKGFTSMGAMTAIDGRENDGWEVKGVALLAIVLVTWLNTMGGAKALVTANLFLVLKLTICFTIIALGVSSVTGILKQRDDMGGLGNEKLALENIHHNLNDTITAQPTGYKQFVNVSDAFLAALFAFGGWESVGFVAGDISNPGQTIPRILNSAMMVIITLFVLVVSAFYAIIPLETLRTTNAVATAFGAQLFGPIGAIFYTWGVCLSCLGALNATVYSAGRLTQAAASVDYIPFSLLNPVESRSISYESRRDFDESSLARNRGDIVTRMVRLPRTFRLSNDPNVPVKAMLLNEVIAAVFVVLSSFRTLLSFKGMIEYCCYFVTVSGLLRSRSDSQVKQLGPSKTYQTSLFNPLIFCIISLVITVQSATQHVSTTVAMLSFVVIGTVIFGLRIRQRVTAKESGETDS